MFTYYDPTAVALSIAVAFLTAYTALNLAGRVSATQGIEARVWLWGGAVSMGFGVWSMHFIGMIALHTPLVLTYDPGWTVVSLLAAIGISAFALRTAAAATLNRWRLACSGAILSCGICAMHYLGMHALNISIPIAYDVATVVASIVVAYIAATAALGLAYRLKSGHGKKLLWHRLGASLLMGLGVAGMHYTGMAAAGFDPNAICVGGIRLNEEGLAPVTAVFAFGVLAITLVLSMIDVRSKSQLGQLLRDLQSANAELEQRVAQRTKELQDLYENAPCGYHSVDALGLIVRMNATELAWLGYTHDEVVGKMYLRDLEAPTSADSFVGVFEDLMCFGGTASFELDFARKDGSILSVAGNATAVSDPDGGLTKVRVTIHDATEKRQAEQALRQTTLFLDLVSESLPMAAFVKDAKTRRYVRWNRAAEVTFGVPRSEVIGRTAEDIFPAHMERISAASDEAVLGKNATVQFGTQTLTLPDGRTRSLRTTKTVVPDELGEPWYVIGTSEDVTSVVAIHNELKRKTLEADEANRAKSDFLASMSHEIRTPMNGVVGMLEVLKRSGLSPDQHEMLASVMVSADSLLVLIDSILDFSKIEAGRLTLEHVPVCLSEVVESACESLVPIAMREGVELIVFCDPALPAQVSTDPTRLRQILLNLVGNAIKFSATPEQRSGKVQVRAELIARTPDDARVRFSVIDNGVGISAQSMPKLFQPFVQAESSTTRRFGGTGLGLSICHRIAAAMGSEIHVTSEVGSGSTFSTDIVFDGVVAAEQPDEARQLQRTLVVAVRPPAHYRPILKAYLESAGARLHCFDDDADALERIARVETPQSEIVFVVFDDSLSAPESTAIERGLARRSRRATFNALHVSNSPASSVTPASPQAQVQRNAMRRSTFLRALIAAARHTDCPVTNESEPTLTASVQPLTIEQAQAAGTLILVAEDHPNNRKVLARQLAVLGVTAEMAVDGEEALAKWQSKRYGLVLTDCHMPALDGFGLTAAIRRLESSGGTRVPIIAITANAMKGEADRCIRAGMDDYLTKPLKLSELERAIRKWLPVPRTAALPISETAVSNHDDAPAAVVADALSQALGTDDPQMLDEFYADFMDSAEGLIADMCSHLVARDLPAIGGLAHRLKSSAGTIGAELLADQSRRLEISCHADDVAAVETLLMAMTSSVSAVRKWLDERARAVRAT